jgi:hypothetical protein
MTAGKRGPEAVGEGTQSEGGGVGGGERARDGGDGYDRR